MSILLEALRKSEKSQSAHVAPTIHTGDHSEVVSDSLKTAPLALLLITALFVSGWFVWRQYQLPADSVSPSDQIVQENIVPEVGPVENAAVPPATDVGENLPASSKPVATEANPQQAAPQNANANTANPRTRTPIESFEPAKTQPVKPATAKPTPATQTPAKQKKQAPEEPTPLSYWDLPDSVRADIPEIKFSVLVYANDPAERFVLINGERLKEGDSPLNGLSVKEIRRDGVVFKYRLYTFLVER